MDMTESAGNCSYNLLLLSNIPCVGIPWECSIDQLISRLQRFLPAFFFFFSLKQVKLNVRHQITSWISSQELLLFEERNMPWTMRRCCWGAVLLGTQSGALVLLFMLVGRKTDMWIAKHKSFSTGAHHTSKDKWTKYFPLWKICF